MPGPCSVARSAAFFNNLALSIAASAWSASSSLSKTRNVLSSVKIGVHNNSSLKPSVFTYSEHDMTVFFNCQT